MIFTPLPLSGAFEVTVEPRGDSRGMFARVFCEAEFSAQRLNTAWPQMNVSVSARAGTVRGLHFQRPPHAEVKLVRALRGRVEDVLLDLRADSPSFGRHVRLTLDAETRNAAYVPEGFAHGFQALMDGCEVQYLCSAPYTPDAEGGVQALDPDLGIAWPLPATVRSARDERLPPLKEVAPL